MQQQYPSELPVNDSSVCEITILLVLLLIMCVIVDQVFFEKYFSFPSGID